MRIKTSIAEIKKDGTECIRGLPLSELIATHSFTQMIFILLRERMPTQEEERMLEAILVSVIDHGPGTASALAARVSASAKNPLHASVAAGLLGFGERHGVAVGPTMNFFRSHAEEKNIKALLADMKKNKQYVPGYGHKIFFEDPRTKALLSIAKREKIYGTYCTFAERVEKILNETSSKKLPLNVDGCIAAILCDMGFDPTIGNGIFIIGRVPGLVAHALEQAASGELLRLNDEEVEYAGI